VDLVDVLMKLSNLDGPSGYEEEVIDYIKKEAQKISKTDIEIDKLGNLIVRKEGRGKKIALFAHVDEIGFIITKKEFGNFFRFSTFGGIDPKAIISQRLRFHTRDKVNIGDIGNFSSEPFLLSEKYLTGKALDNRAGCAVLLYIMEILNEFVQRSESFFVFNIREEDGISGARGICYRIKPDLAIILDVTHGDISRPSYPRIETGKGPVLDIGPMISYEYFERIKNLAEKIYVNYQIEPTGGVINTDNDIIKISAGGIPTLLISIPLRYMHTPYEIVNIKDLEETARLLAHFIARGGE
jgi:endoglucanase